MKDNNNVESMSPEGRMTLDEFHAHSQEFWDEVRDHPERFEEVPSGQTMFGKPVTMIRRKDTDAQPRS